MGTSSKKPVAGICQSPARSLVQFFSNPPFVAGLPPAAVFINLDEYLRACLDCQDYVGCVHITLSDNCAGTTFAPGRLGTCNEQLRAKEYLSL